MSIDADLLDIICCPATRLPLRVMPAEQVDALNRRIGEGALVGRDGGKLTEPLTEALVTRDGKLAYPVRDGIPVLLEDSGIVLSQLDDAG